MADGCPYPADQRRIVLIGPHSAGMSMQRSQEALQVRTYYQLSFTVDGKNLSLFVKKPDLKALRDCVKRYQGGTI
jgi:hypothetical protein